LCGEAKQKSWPPGKNNTAREFRGRGAGGKRICGVGCTCHLRPLGKFVGVEFDGSTE
jgi:hypothetical protein